MIRPPSPLHLSLLPSFLDLMITNTNRNMTQKNVNPQKKKKKKRKEGKECQPYKLPLLECEKKEKHQQNNML